jgi:hypothetical protein
MMTVLYATAFAVVIGNLAMLLLLFIERPDDRDKWR